MIGQKSFDATVDEVVQGLARFSAALVRAKSRKEAAELFRDLVEICTESAETFEVLTGNDQ